MSTLRGETGVPGGGLHVYRIDARAAAALPDAFFACLPEAERQRVQRLKRPGDRLNRRTAYAALLRLAARHGGMAPEDLRIGRAAGGKPFLDPPRGHAPLHVSVSHSGDLVLLALAASPVGVDVERIRPIDAAPLRQDYFPQDPIAADAPASSFFALWTIKEAALKAAGNGLSVDPAGLVVDRQAVGHPPSSRCPADGPPPDDGRPAMRAPHRKEDGRTIAAFHPLAACPPGLGLEEARIARLPMPEGYAAAVAVLPGDAGPSSLPGPAGASPRTPARPHRHSLPGAGASTGAQGWGPGATLHDLDLDALLGLLEC